MIGIAHRSSRAKEKTYVCIKFMPSSAPTLKPSQFVTVPTLALAKTTLTMPLIIVAALPTRNVCRMIMYGTSLCALSKSERREGPLGETMST